MPATRPRKAKPVAMCRAARFLLVLPIRYHASNTASPTITPCQTIARNSGSDHDSRGRRLGAARGAPILGSKVALDMGGPWAQRIGGAYCKPPLVQRLLIPRGTPMGVMLRSHISPKLPTCLMML